MPLSRLTNFKNGVERLNSDVTFVASSITLTAGTAGATGDVTDNGGVFVVTTDGATITLPAITSAEAGQSYTVVIGNPNVGVNISPNANDGIAWAGDVTDDRDVLLNASEAFIGDRFEVWTGPTATADGAWYGKGVGNWRKATA